MCQMFKTRSGQHSLICKQCFQIQESAADHMSLAAATTRRRHSRLTANHAKRGNAAPAPTAPCHVLVVAPLEKQVV